MATMPLLNFAMVGRLRRYRVISAATVGKAMVAAAHRKMAERLCMSMTQSASSLLRYRR
jgi:hypothetical protein